jgi:hypothetical protein
MIRARGIRLVIVQIDTTLGPKRKEEILTFLISLPEKKGMSKM